MKKIEHKNPETLAKRIVWLAWRACGGPVGMGVLQDRSGADENAVWTAAYGRNDYPGGNSLGDNKPGDVYCDYVFGRMMKLSVRWDETGVFVPEGTPRGDYQSWCKVYPTYEILFEVAASELQ